MKRFAPLLAGPALAAATLPVAVDAPAALPWHEAELGRRKAE